MICGGPYGNYGKWGSDRYATVAEFYTGTGMEEHGVEAFGYSGLFVSGAGPPADSSTQAAVSTNDLRPASGTPMVDAGGVIPNINDGYAGTAPDSGCLEGGDPLPAYGPR